VHLPLELLERVDDARVLLGSGRRHAHVAGTEPVVVERFDVDVALPQALGDVGRACARVAIAAAWLGRASG
jgi:hypothetical protein